MSKAALPTLPIVDIIHEMHHVCVFLFTQALTFSEKMTKIPVYYMNSMNIPMIRGI